MKKCKTCLSDTLNPKFCSNSCAAKYNNVKSPKRKKTKTCSECSEKIYSPNKRCKKHHEEWIKSKEPKDITLKEATNLKGHRASAFGTVRNRARAVAKKLGFKKCRHCGYDKHIEIAHIKPIKDFSDDTLLSVINAESNLIPLCPNCHWEFDHNL